MIQESMSLKYELYYPPPEVNYRGDRKIRFRLKILVSFDTYSCFEMFKAVVTFVYKYAW